MISYWECYLFSTLFTTYMIQPMLLNQPWCDSTDQYLQYVTAGFFHFDLRKKIFSFWQKNSQKILKIKYSLTKIKNKNFGCDILDILLLGKCLVISVQIGHAVFAESRVPWPHVEFGAVDSMKLAFYCSELQCLETICNDQQLKPGFCQYIVLLLKY